MLFSGLIPIYTIHAATGCLAWKLCLHLKTCGIWKQLVNEKYIYSDRYDNYFLVYLCRRNFPSLKFALQVSSQAAITCSKVTSETMEQGVKYVQS